MAIHAYSPIVEVEGARAPDSRAEGEEIQQVDPNRFQQLRLDRIQLQQQSSRLSKLVIFQIAAVVACIAVSILFPFLAPFVATGGAFIFMGAGFTAASKKQALEELRAIDEELASYEHRINMERGRLEGR